MAEKSKSRPRSGCPVSMSLEQFGDRWSLLMIRDMMVRGYHTFKEFRESGEGISTNVLSDRLRTLEAAGILLTEPDETDARRLNYRLTQKGIDLAPVMLELLIWGAKYESTAAPCAFIVQMENCRAQVLAETYKRWRERDSTPLIPRFNEMPQDNPMRNSERRKR
ncbi:MAG TPA: helix-turn-helix domain-containing protein [Acidobacteriaceae bacterium]|nr:helix-turn-helix domain-containing protein [Acidobacteriaceae bacterium]